MKPGLRYTEKDLRPLALSHSLCPPTCTGDIVLLQNLVVSAGTHSASWDGKAEGTAAPIIQTACIVTWRNRFEIRCLAHSKLHFLKPTLSACISFAVLSIFLLHNKQQRFKGSL